MTMMPDILLVERVSQTQVLGTQRKGNMCLRQEVAQTNLKFHSD